MTESDSRARIEFWFSDGGELVVHAPWNAETFREGGFNPMDEFGAEIIGLCESIKGHPLPLVMKYTGAQLNHIAIYRVGTPELDDESEASTSA